MLIVNPCFYYMDLNNSFGLNFRSQPKPKKARILTANHIFCCTDYMASIRSLTKEFGEHDETKKTRNRHTLMSIWHERFLEAAVLC